MLVKFRHLIYLYISFWLMSSSSSVGPMVNATGVLQPKKLIVLRLMSCHNICVHCGRDSVGGTGTVLRAGRFGVRTLFGCNIFRTRPYRHQCTPESSKMCTGAPLLE